MAPLSSAGGNGRSLWKSRRLSLLLLILDAIGFSLCWIGAYHLRAALNTWFGPINQIDPYLTVFPVIVAVAILNCGAFGLYVHRRRLSSLNQPRTLIRAGYHWLLYIIVVAFFFKELDLGRSIILLSALMGLVYLFGSRTLLRTMKKKSLSRGVGTVRCGIVGTGTLAREVAASLRDHPEVGFTIVGFMSHGNGSADFESGDEPLLGDAANLAEIIERHDIEEIFLAIADLGVTEQMNLLSVAEYRGVSVHVVSNIFDVITDNAKGDEIATFPVVTLRDGHLPLHQAVLKRTLDIVTSLFGVIVWFLFFHWWIAFLIRRESPGPVFFRQERVGRDGRRFELIKYRTMSVEAPAYAVAPTEESDPRITPCGRWLRRTSLDELPQLWNVLRGEMSMVGPRPEMPFIVEKYQPWERRRLDVKPGLTGLWQVIGRKNLPLHLNMQYDLYYIKNQSFWLDLEILVRTLPAVLKGKGAF